MPDFVSGSGSQVSDSSAMIVRGMDQEQACDRPVNQQPVASIESANHAAGCA